MTLDVLEALGSCYLFLSFLYCPCVLVIKGVISRYGSGFVASHFERDSVYTYCSLFHFYIKIFDLLFY